MDIAEITAADLQDDIKAPIVIDEYREEVIKRMENGRYMNILAGYTGSVFQDFDSYLRPEVDLVEDDIRLVLDKYKSSFITFELEPGSYTSDALFNILQLENPGPSNTIVIKF